MIQRRLARFALLAALGLTAMPALAGKVEKAEKMLTKYAGTDHVALAKAYDAANQAKVDPKTRDAAFTWVVLAEVLKAYALDPDAESPAPDAAVAALDAYDAALEALGWIVGDRAEPIDGVPQGVYFDDSGAVFSVLAIGPEAFENPDLDGLDQVADPTRTLLVLLAF